MFVENLNYGYNENGNVVVSADIVNRGYHTRDDLNVYLTEKTADGNVVASRDAGYSRTNGSSDSFF